MSVYGKNDAQNDIQDNIIWTHFERRKMDFMTNLKFISIANLIFILWLILIFLNQPWSDIHLLGSIILTITIAGILLFYISLPSIEDIGFNSANIFIKKRNIPIEVIKFWNLIDLRTMKINSSIIKIRTKETKIFIGPLEESYIEKMINAYHNYELNR